MEQKSLFMPGKISQFSKNLEESIYLKILRKSIRKDF